MYGRGVRIPSNKFSRNARSSKQVRYVPYVACILAYNTWGMQENLSRTYIHKSMRVYR